MGRLTVVLIAVSVLLLGGAWLAARALTGDVKAPPSNLTEVPAAPLVRPPPVVTGTRPPPEPVPAPAPTPTPAPVAAPQPIVPPPPPPTPERTGGELEVDRIVTEAQAQLNLPEDRSGPATLRRAEKLFERCLLLSSEEQRCKQGLEDVRRRLGPRPPPPPPGRRPPPPPPEPSDTAPQE